jgi:hypothetical protein
MLHLSQEKTGAFEGKTPSTFQELASKSTIAKNAFEKAGILKPTPQGLDALVEIKPKTVSVPRTQLPVGEGEKNVSKLESRVRQTLSNITPEQIDKLGLSTYKHMSNKDQIAEASKYVTANPEEALKVLNGDIEPPKGLLKNSIYVAMVNNSEGSLELQTKLATLSATRFGQEIEILKEIDKNSPIKWMDQIIKVKADAIQKKYGKPTEEVIKSEVNKIKASIEAPNKYDWAAFVDSIQC